MSNKSHVGMGHYVCPFCYKKHSEVLLLDKHLKDTLEQDNMLGFELCDEHKLLAKDYVLLIGTTGDPNKDPKATALGKNAAIRRGSELIKAFKMDLAKYDYVFVDPDVIEFIEGVINNSENPDSSET
jgi:hypothetical protein